MKLTTKLLAIALVPMLLAACLGAMVIRTQLLGYRGLSETAANLGYLRATSLYATAIQRERGTASLVLAGGVDPSSFDAFSARSRSAAAEWKKAADRSAMPASVINEIAGTESVLDGARVSVKNRALTAEKAFSFYTSTVSLLLESCALAALGADPDAASRLFTLVTLEEAKEWAGRTRALVASSAVADLRIGPDSAAELMIRFGAIRALLSSRVLDLDEEGRADLDLVLGSPEYEELKYAAVELARKSETGGYGLDGMRLFDKATTLVSMVQVVIDRETERASAELSSRESKVRLSFASLAGASILLLAAVAVVTALTLGSASRRIRAIGRAFRDLAEGEGDLTRRIEVATKDEIGELASNFNSFAGSLGRLVGRVKEEAAALSGGMDELSANMNQTASAVQEIAATIDSIRRRSSAQASSVAESAATVDEIAHRVESLAAAIGRQSEHVSASSASIEQMVANVQSVTANVERMGTHYERLDARSGSGRDSMRLASSQAKGIDAQSETLQEANALIAGIAARTNLLAMNAAIEAAHAGEAGRGFAVVADEIRKLAESAAAQSKTVARNIGAIRRSIGEVVSTSSEAERAFYEITEQIDMLSRLQDEVRYSMQEQSAGSAQILDSLSSMNGVTQEVRTEASRMREGSASVLEGMERLKRLTAELEAGMGEMAAGAGEIRTAAAETSELSIKASESVRALAAETEKFKT